MTLSSQDALFIGLRLLETRRWDQATTDPPQSRNFAAVAFCGRGPTDHVMRTPYLYGDNSQVSRLQLLYEALN